MQTKKKIKIALIIILMLVEVFTIHLMYKSAELKNSELPKVKIKNENNISKKQFAIMLETSAGSKQYENRDADYPDALPTEGYKFNIEKSGCIDVNGKEVKNVLSYDYGNYILTLTPSNTVYCYLYYDIYVSPTITITKTNDEYDSIAVQVDVSENTEVDKYYYSIDSETNYTELSTNTYTFTGLESGSTHTIRVYIKDTLGIMSEVKEQELTTKERGMTGLQLAQQAIANKAPLKGLNNNVEGGMYRYQGSCSSGDSCVGVVDNYICFGTTSKEECVGNTDQYMYRIIGIDSVSNELKLIKKEAINSTAQWYYYQYNNYSYLEDGAINWPQSDIVQRLNGYTSSNDGNNRTLTNLFVDSGISYPYMSKTGYNGINWYNLISPHRWYYGDSFDWLKPLNMYEVETGQRSAQWYITTSGSSTRGKWTQMSVEETNKYKIGLMQVHDYYYSPSKGGIDCYSYPSTCVAGWMNMINNDASGLDGITTPPPGNYEAEWTMSRFGLTWGGNTPSAWEIAFGHGAPSDQVYNVELAVRPVFYLTSNVRIEGDGTFSNPYVIINAV